MPLATAADLLDVLRQHRLLEQRLLDKAAGELSAAADPPALTREMVKRGWLTPYQANQLILGRAAELSLGAYVILDKLGEGGMGKVFRARHRRLNRIDALKVIRKDRFDAPDAVSRFQREARAAARLQHPNIVTVYDTDEIAGLHFISMEYVEGIDLARLVKQQGPLSPALACEYVRQAALGLQHAHERGLVHRDIKPANLMIADCGLRTADSGAQANPASQSAISNPQSAIVKILDLGLARVQSAQSSMDALGQDLTVTGMVMGTPDFMAPEQAIDSHEVTIAADIYSLGCTLYYLLAGRPPFVGGSIAQKLMWHQQAEPPSVTTLRPDLPPTLLPLLQKMLAKRPEARYRTPAELAAALAPFCVPMAIPVAAPASPALDEDASDSLGGTFGGGETVPLPSEPSTPALTPKRRVRIVALAGVVLVLALAAWGLVKWLGGQPGAAGPAGAGGGSPPPAIQPKDAKTLLAEGDSLFKKHDYEGAVAAYAAVLKLEPENVKALVGRGRAYIGQATQDIPGYELAAIDFRNALAQEPRNPHALVGRGRVRNHLREQDRAIADYDAALAIDPNLAEAYRERGLSYLVKGDPIQAARDYERALQLDPADARASYLRGRLCESDKDYDKALELYGRAIRADANETEAYLLRAGLYLRHKNNLDLALADYQQAVRLEPKRAICYRLRGVVLRAKGRLDEAIADFSKSLALRPEAVAYYNRGDAYEAIKDYEKALADYVEAFRLDPADADYRFALAAAYNNRGNLAFARKDYQKAIADLDEAIRLEPKLGTPYRNRGNCLQKLGDLEQAIVNYRKAVELEPNDDANRELLASALNNRAKSFFDKGEFDRALADCTEAITLAEAMKQKPRILKSFYRNRGLAYHNQEQYDQAIADFSKAIQLDDTFAEAYLSRGKAWEKKGEPNKAKADLTRAGELDPSLKDK